MTTFSLKSLKIAQFASEETLCFNASLYADGKKVATVGNDGHGGAHHIRWDRKLKSDRIADLSADLKAQGGAIDPELLEVVTREDGSTYCLEGMAWELVIDELVAREEVRKEVRRDMKRKLVFTKGDGTPGIFNFSVKRGQTATPRWFEQATAHTLNKYPKATIINNLSEEQAIDVYLAN